MGHPDTKYRSPRWCEDIRTEGEVGNSDGKLVMYSGSDQIRNYIKDNKSQISHFQERKLQIWQGKKLE